MPDVHRDGGGLVLRGLVERDSTSTISHKTQQALVGSSYSTTKPYSEIRKHDDEELARRGWKFHREQEVADWGRDLGGRTTECCKGDYRASLQYAGQRAQTTAGCLLSI